MFEARELYFKFTTHTAEIIGKHVFNGPDGTIIQWQLPRTEEKRSR